MPPLSPIAQIVANLALHLVLALVLVLVLGWFGRHSTKVGYLSLSLFVKRDEAPAFNLAFKIFAPLVGIVISSALLYALGLDGFVDGIWIVALFYVMLRVGHSLAFGRLRIIHWKREVVLAVATIGGACLLDSKVISVRENLMPDPASVATELWVVVAVFVYATLNRVKVGTRGAKTRKSRYVRHAYTTLKGRHHSIVKPLVPDDLVESLVYTVMIYEGFQRPRVAQAFERIWKRSGGTYGPMQMEADEPLSDVESIRQGVERIVRSYEKERVAERDAPESITWWERQRLARAVAFEYNPDDDYANSIAALQGTVAYHFYPKLSRAEDTAYPDDEAAGFL